jgi:hypothetical protein
MNLCFRCGGPGAHWLHRLTREERDQHTHCTCNGVYLCTTCHEWVHAHPFEARGVGLIVSRHTPLPALIPAESHFGVLNLGCDGRFAFYIEEET